MPEGGCGAIFGAATGRCAAGAADAPNRVANNDESAGGSLLPADGAVATALDNLPATGNLILLFAVEPVVDIPAAAGAAGVAGVVSDGIEIIPLRLRHLLFRPDS